MFLKVISRRTQSYHSSRDALKRMQSKPKDSIFDTIKGAQNDLGKPIAARVSFSQDFKAVVLEHRFPIIIAKVNQVEPNNI